MSEVPEGLKQEKAAHSSIIVPPAAETLAAAARSPICPIIVEWQHRSL